MEHDPRRHEVGKIFLDVAKYVFTIVVVGGVFAGQFGLKRTGAGTLLGAAIALTGFFMIPRKQDGP